MGVNTDHLDTCRPLSLSFWTKPRFGLWLLAFSRIWLVSQNDGSCTGSLALAIAAWPGYILRSVDRFADMGLAPTWQAKQDALISWRSLPKAFDPFFDEARVNDQPQLQAAVASIADDRAGNVAVMHDLLSIVRFASGFLLGESTVLLSARSIPPACSLLPVCSITR
jgi:hypothetical protein